MLTIDLHLECPYEFALELARAPHPGAPPLRCELVTANVVELASEAFTCAVLAGTLPPDPSALRVRVTPVWREEPLVAEIEVELSAELAERTVADVRRFSQGRWLRIAEQAVLELRAAGTLAADESVYPLLYAERRREPAALPVPMLVVPEITAQPLDELGAGELEPGAFTPDRPVLASARMVEEILALTEASGLAETGGAALGKLIRLPRPLPGTTTPVVTVLTACLGDERHAGAPSRFSFSPEALFAADQVAELRGLGERVLTVFHSHGWGTGCSECNQREQCALPQCTLVSLDDYRVLETLFPSKATLMPIAGRKLGASGRRPVLEIHAWRGGAVRPIQWRTFRD